ncbi:MAG: CDP-alcohol phosphatidyltransferase family protein [Alloprevotella sp.]|nr:CDP-alcohol phosphatidyltransferase family protein [Alloprevotella sp.]
METTKLNQTSTLQSSLKSLDTEEWLDIHFTRPLGLLWAHFFIRLGVHPNVVTVLSIFLGVAAGVLFYFDSFTLNALGVLLLVWANIYDSTDGQMARMTGQKTRLGRILDGAAGDFWFVAIYSAISLRLMPQNIPGTDVKWGVWIWLFCAFAGFVCHAKQCQLADYYRNIHLYFLKGKSGSELDSSPKLREEFATLSWGKDFLWKFFLMFYVNYTSAQEKMTPRWQSLRRTLKETYGDGPAPEAVRQEFRKGSLPLMPLANASTFNLRAIALYVGILAAIPWLYPLFEVTVMNVIAYVMRQRHERLCARIEANIKQ